MRITDLLEPKYRHEERIWSTFVESLSEDPNVLWYPSSGTDCRPIVQFSIPHKVANKNIEELPDLFVYTDYMGMNYSIEEGKILFESKWAKITIREKLNLSWKQDFYYSAQKPFKTFGRNIPESEEFLRRFTDFPTYLPRRKTLFLLPIEVQSEILGTFTRPVLYILMESMNFLCEILLKNKIEASHLVKVRDGAGLGGNGKSAAHIYLFLSALKTKYLIADEIGYLQFPVIDSIVEHYSLNLKRVDLELIWPDVYWSDFNTNVYKVEQTTDQSTEETHLETLKQITQNRKERIKQPNWMELLQSMKKSYDACNAPYKGPSFRKLK